MKITAWIEFESEEEKERWCNTHDITYKPSLSFSQRCYQFIKIGLSRFIR